MDNYQIECNLISCGINQVFDGSEWKSKNCILFCSNNSILLYDMIQKKVRLSLVHHKKKVQCVRWLILKNQVMIFSTSDDGTIAQWKCSVNTNNYSENIDLNEQYIQEIWDHNNWTVISQINLSSKIKKLQISPLNEIEYILSTSNLQGELFFISVNCSELKIVEKLNFGKNIMDSVCLHQLSSNKILVIMAGYDKQVHFYQFDNSLTSNKTQFIHSCHGHEDNVTDIKLITLYNKQNLIATSDKRGSIRIWRLQILDPLIAVDIYSNQKNIKIIKIFNEQQILSLESIVIGHSDQVSSLMWGLMNKDKAKEECNILLLSSAFDFSTYVWKKEVQSGLWMNICHLGQLSGSKHAFFNSKFSPDMNHILAYSYNGSASIYNRIHNNQDSLQYRQSFIMGGHFNEVTDIDWSSNSDYLVSCSTDQTTRIWQKCAFNQNWYEVSRPQIHGYDIHSIANLKVNKFNQQGETFHYADLIVSGADEKIIRLFEPPAIFINIHNNLNQNQDQQLHLYFPDTIQEKQFLIPNSQNQQIVQYKIETEGGQQVLGLLTKAVKVEKPKYTNYYDEEEDVDMILEKQNEKQAIDYQQPPNDDFIQKHTLWPEMNKLYAHGYEIRNVRASLSGKILISSCKSQSIEDSKIYIWECETFKVIQKLEGHNFTITQLEISFDDQLIGSVSRDRQLCIYKFDYIDKQYRLFKKVQDHSKIIWSLAFSSCQNYVVTGSRDKKVIVYQILTDDLIIVNQQNYQQSVTAVAFSTMISQTQQFLVTGLENGQIIVQNFIVVNDSVDIQILFVIPQHLSPALKVNRIRFVKSYQNNKQFAVCSEDCSLRIYTILKYY